MEYRIVKENKTAKAVVKAIYAAGESTLPDGDVVFLQEQLVPISFDGEYEYTLRFKVLPREEA